MAKNTIDNNNLDWIKIKEVDVTEDIGQLPETSKDKLYRKVRENPFVPIGKHNLFLKNNIFDVKD